MMRNDETIGQRMYLECRRVYGYIAEAQRTLGVSHRGVISKWKLGQSCPQAYFLAEILKDGGDINYILLGGERDEVP